MSSSKTPDEINFHLSFKRTDSHYLSSGSMSGLIVRGDLRILHPLDNNMHDSYISNTDELTRTGLDCFCCALNSPSEKPYTYIMICTLVYLIWVYTLHSVTMNFTMLDCE